MTTDFFDTLYPSAIEGVIDDPVVTDPDNTPNHVLELDQDWRVDIEWQLSSNNTSYPVDMIDGTWHIQLSVESLGPGFEDDIADANVPTSTANPDSWDLRVWNHQFTIPAGAIPDEAVYKLATLITFVDDNNNRRAMAGFAEGPVLSFYRDQP